MSSQLIGELGQVGLKIGDSTAVSLTPPNNCFSGDEKKKTKLHPSSRPKKFRQAWMMFDIFKDWLRPHTSPEFATCIVCNRVIKAGKSELEKHAAGKRHQMLRGNNAHATAATVLMGQELMTQSELPVSMGMNGENVAEDVTDGGNGAGSAATVADDYGGISCIEAASYNTFSGDTGSSHTDAYQQAITRQHQIMAPPPPQELITKAIVGKPAPGWKATAIVNGHITKLDLSDYRGRYLILFFYPQDFNRVCASEINSLSDHVSEFRASQTEIVACSVDSHLCHLAWTKVIRLEGGIGNPKIPLISDPTHSISKDYGVFVHEKGHSLRGTFIIDKRGILRAVNIYEPSIGRGVEELLRIIRALEYSDETEESILADWSPTSLK